VAAFWGLVVTCGDDAVGVPNTGREKISPAGGALTISDGGFVNVIVGGFGKDDPVARDGEAPPPFVPLPPESAGGGENADEADPGGLGILDAAGIDVVATGGRENKFVAFGLGGDKLRGGTVAIGAAVGALPNVPTGGGGNLTLIGSPPEPGDGAPGGPGELNRLVTEGGATAGLGDMLYDCCCCGGAGGGGACTP
jgi:hypothetical protein